MVSHLVFSVLMMSNSPGRIAHVKLLLHHGANVNAEDHLCQTPLLVSVSTDTWENTEVVRLLCIAGIYGKSRQ